MSGDHQHLAVSRPGVGVGPHAPEDSGGRLGGRAGAPLGLPDSVDIYDTTLRDGSPQ